METLIIHPRTKMQVFALETIFKDMRIKFEKEGSKADTFTLSEKRMINAAIKDAKEGKVTRIKGKDGINKMLGI